MTRAGSEGKEIKISAYMARQWWFCRLSHLFDFRLVLYSSGVFGCARL